MKITLEQAQAVADIIKAKCNYGTADKPEWFVNAVPFMNQDASYSVDICVSDLKLVPDSVKDRFLFAPLKDVSVFMRTVRPAPKYEWKKKADKGDAKV